MLRVTFLQGEDRTKGDVAMQIYIQEACLNYKRRRIVFLFLFVQVLLQAGAHIDAQDTLDRTPLLRSVVEQHCQAVDLLIRHGARLNVEDINGYTPLCQAVWNNSVPIVTSLILAGAKITQSHYLLHYSVVNNHTEITNRLIVAGSVVNLRDESGNTPLILAAKHGKIDTTNFLLEHGEFIIIS